MTGLSESATQRRIDALCCRAKPRYLNRNTHKRYRVIADDGQQCELQGIDMKSTYASHEALADKNVWERIP